MQASFSYLLEQLSGMGEGGLGLLTAVGYSPLLMRTIP